MRDSILKEEYYGEQPDEPAEPLAKLLSCVALVDDTIVVRHKGWERNCDIRCLKWITTDRRHNVVGRQVKAKLRGHTSDSKQDQLRTIAIESVKKLRT